MEYIEQNCTIEHEGKTFESGGSCITDRYVIGYVGKPIRKNSYGEFETIGNYLYPFYELTNWHGEVLGTLQVISRWNTPRSYMSTQQYAVNITLQDGKCYKGRTCGEGMVVKGKRFIRKGKPCTFNELD